MLELPPLRDRRTDIPLLIEHFLDRYCGEFARPTLGFSAEAMQALTAHSWPGNVRELENVIQRCVALAPGDVIDLAGLPPELSGVSGASADGAFPTDVGVEGLPLEPVLEDYERTLLKSALLRADGVKKDAAALLKISFRSFRYRLQKLGLDDEDV